MNSQLAAKRPLELKRKLELSIYLNSLLRENGEGVRREKASQEEYKGQPYYIFRLTIGNEIIDLSARDLDVLCGLEDSFGGIDPELLQDAPKKSSAHAQLQVLEELVGKGLVVKSSDSGNYMLAERSNCGTYTARESVYEE